MTKEADLKLIVGLDFSECGERALRSALRLAKGRNAIIHIAHAVTRQDLGAGTKIEQQDEALEHLPRTIWKKVFEALDALQMGYEDVPLSLHVRLGKPLDTIRQVAADYRGDLIIVGTHGRKGVSKLVLGSVADGLIRDGRFPVLVAHENKLSEIERTILPDQPLPPGHQIQQPTPERPHIYRSTLIDAWSAFGRPTRSSIL